MVVYFEQDKLKKRYFDCVSRQGEALEIYLARLYIEKSTLHYSYVLVSDIHCGIILEHSMKKFSLPESDNDKLILPETDLIRYGESKALSATVRKEWKENDGSTLEWHCVQTNSVAPVSLASGFEITGLGYAERVTQSLNSLRYSFKELHWSHFLSPDDSLVWIDRKGSGDPPILFRNGAEIPRCSVSEDFVFGGENDLRLIIYDKRVLRRGNIAKRVLPNTRGLKSLLPHNILGIEECKRLGRGELTNSDGSKRYGTVVNEIVEFP